jgi:hypothetical protein
VPIAPVVITETIHIISNKLPLNAHLKELINFEIKALGGTIKYLLNIKIGLSPHVFEIKLEHGVYAKVRENVRKCGLRLQI